MKRIKKQCAVVLERSMAKHVGFIYFVQVWLIQVNCESRNANNRRTIQLRSKAVTEEPT